MSRKQHTQPINNLTIPPETRRELYTNHIIDTVERLLDADEWYQQNRRQLRSRFTAGLINVGVFNAIRRWQIGDAIRRAGLPLAVTRGYLLVDHAVCA